VPIGIEHIDRPVAAGEIAAEPRDGQLALREIVVRVGNLLERADLERDLVDVHAVLVVRLAHAFGSRSVDSGKRMMIGAVRGEDRVDLAVAPDYVGLAKPQHVHVDPACHPHVRVPQREMAEPARLERLWQQHAAHIV
jgi:hypothetical protein